MMAENPNFPSWESEPIFDAIVGELIGIHGDPFDIVIEPGEARLVASRIIGRLRHLGRENDPAGFTPLVDVFKALREVYDERGALIWLTSSQVWPHPNGGTYHASAMFILKEGRSEEVMQKIEQLQSGAYV
jgi:hypothetical protein